MMLCISACQLNCKPSPASPKLFGVSLVAVYLDHVIIKRKHHFYFSCSLKIYHTPGIFALKNGLDFNIPEI